MFQRYFSRLCICLWLIALTSACKEPERTLPAWQTIHGRDEASTSGILTRYPVYRARVPKTWRRIDPDDTESIADTTKPLCEFWIDDPLGPIRIVVHNFPADSLEQRIPPQAQLVRWKRQANFSDALESQTIPFAHGGFAGFQLSGPGLIAWAMQLSATHFQSLLLPGNSAEKRFFRQMRADYTLKATGPPESLERHRNALIAFARSFELIQEVPAP